MRKAAVRLATGFGSGYLPYGGSWGSLVMLIACWWLLRLPLAWFGLIAAVLFFIGVSIADIADRHLVKRTGIAHDNNQVVIDEFVGMMITLLPLYIFPVTLLNLAIAFVVFRFFDALKFGLAKLADDLHNRWGVMLDDLVAGVHSGIALYVILLLVE